MKSAGRTPETAPKPAPEPGGHFFILFASILWGTSGTVQALAPAEATPQVIAAFRLMISGLFILAHTLIKRSYNSGRAFFQPVFLLTGLVQATFHVTYFAGIAHTGVALGSMIAIGSSPIFTGILGFFFNNEKIGPRWLIATTAALLGVGVLFLGDAESVQVDAMGILLAGWAGFSFALFTLLAGRHLRHSTSSVVISSSFIAGSIFLMPVLFLYPLAWISTGPGLSVVLYMGLISAGVAYLFYGRGLKTVPVSTIGTLTLAEPLTASLLGIFFLHENLTTNTLAGIVLIFTAQVILSTGRHRTDRS